MTNSDWEPARVKEPTFDIFSGGPDKDPIWLETVTGLSNARERMEQIGRRTPGQYFLFSVQSQTVLARIETFKSPEALCKAQGSTA
jgi:hypothetical protein